MQDLFRRYGKSLTALFLLLTAFWLLALVVLPNISLFEQSFRPYLPFADVGGPLDVYSFDNYRTFFASPTPTTVLGIPVTISTHLLAFLDTVFYSVIVTVICLALAYPLAYYLAKVAKPQSLPVLLLLLFIPLWVSEALRAFAWYIILTFNGPLNQLLMALGLMDKGIRWQQGVITDYDAIVAVLVYCYVLFMLLPRILARRGGRRICGSSFRMPSPASPRAA